MNLNPLARQVCPEDEYPAGGSLIAEVIRLTGSLLAWMEARSRPCGAGFDGC